MSKSHDATLLERLTFFSDAVFAIAITLLVIEVRVPQIHGATEAELGRALVALIPKYVGFVVSFFVIGRFWLGHHRLFGLLRNTDDRLTYANILLLLGIAFTPFPTAVFSEYVNLKTATFFYTGWLIVLGLLNMRLVHVALRDALLDPAHDPVLANHLRHGAWLPILIGIAASAAAFAGPLFVLFVLVIGPILGSFVLHRTRKPALNETDPAAGVPLEPSGQL
jgi:uncharacterized membrane protein